MKKRLLAAILIFVIIISAAGILYYTSYPVISVGKLTALSSEKFTEEFHSEFISISAAGSELLPDSPVQKRKLDEVWSWNNSVSSKLREHSVEGGLAYNIKASGEIENGKTTLRYEGYVIKEDGKRIDFSEEKTFNFVLCSEKRFFTDKL